MIVSDHLINDGNKDTIEDASDLKDIENVKGDETFKQDGSKLTWQADGNDIYYQGTSTKETPVSQTITYSLDGKEVKPEELVGKSGKVTIRFDYTNNETVKTKIDGKEEEIYVPFAAISGMVLDDSFSNVKVTNGKVISDGKNNIVVGYALPGLKESLDVDDSDFDGDVSIPDYVEVTADVENFSLSTTMTVVMNATNFISKDGDADLSEVDDMLDTLTDATDQLKDGSGELADGVDTLKSKMGEFKDGVGTLKNGIKDYTDGASTLSTGIGTLKSGVDTLAGSVPTLISGVGTLKDGSASAAKGASSLKDGAGTLKKGAKDVSTGANTLSNGVKDLSTGANTLSGGASSLNDGVQSIATNMKTLVSGAKQVSDGAASLNAGVSTLIGKLNDMGTTLATNKAGLEAQLQEKGTSLENAQATINALKEVQQSLIQGIAVEGTKPDTAIAIFSQVSQKLNVPISNSIDAASVIASLSDKIATIGQAQGAANVIDTVAGQLAGQDTQEQLTALATGASQLAAGAQNVYDGASQLSTGADAAAAGSAQVAQGAADLATGAGTLKTGAASLATGAGKVADGASTLHKGASDLSDGLNTLDGGIGQLKEKAGSLSTGADQLKSGTDQLATGASTLVSNNQKLNDGAGTLSDGTDAIIDGVGELSDGAHKLADGITEFSEEGIDEIINSYNGDIEPLVDRIQAVLDAGADYQTYTDIADGVNGSVKFIIKTDAVKAED